MNFEGKSSEPKLEDLNIKVPKFATKDNKDVFEEETYTAEYEGLPLTVSIISNSYFEEKDDHLPYTRIGMLVYTKDEDRKTFASTTLTLLRTKDGKYEATTRVENKNREWRGLGRTLWEITLQLIQKVSSNQGLAITSTVVRFPAEGLSKEQWDKLFIPLLEKKGYLLIDKEKGRWQKVYKPD